MEDQITGTTPWSKLLRRAWPLHRYHLIPIMKIISYNNLKQLYQCNSIISQYLLLTLCHHYVSKPKIIEQSRVRVEWGALLLHFTQLSQSNNQIWVFDVRNVWEDVCIYDSIKISNCNLNLTIPNCSVFLLRSYYCC